ncbi:MAG: alpha/beta hydrolase [Methylotenera sp.]|nr:alpha/beta hydrolase [Oligoflexia bacterium]
MKVLRHRSRTLLILLAISGLLAGGYQAARYLAPIQLSELTSRVELWRAGVREIQTGGLAGLEKNHCASEEVSQNNPGCTCIVMIHGLGDQALTWKKLLQEPRSSWLKPVHLFAYDLPGSGRSPPPANPSDYRVRKLAERLKRTLAEVPACSRWMVVGNSLGGAVGTWLALDWKQKVFKLVLVDSSGLKAMATQTHGLFGASTEEGAIAELKDFQKKAYAHPRQLPPHVWRAAAERMLHSNSAEVQKAQVPEDALDTNLPSMRVPTLVYRGAADQIIPRGLSQEMARLIPGAVYRETPDCGHLPQKECPAALVKVLNEMVWFGAM